MSLILAQLAQADNFVEWAKWLIIIISVIGIVLVVLRQSQVQLPSWVWYILGIVALAFFAILALRFLERM